jgi:hypothetical protein
MKQTRVLPTTGFLIAAAPWLAGTAGVALPSAAHAVDPFALYGPRIEFALSRNGTPVGSHVIRFEDGVQGLNVNSVFDIKINFLFFTAYRYRYESDSLWNRDKLIRLRAVTNDDGAKTTVEAAWRGDRFVIRGPEGEAAVGHGLYPTDHWNPGVLATSRVLNTITGRVNDVRIVPQGTEFIVAEDRTIAATHYRYTGDLENEVWYDDRGRWVKMRFKAKDGSTIDYQCRRCLGPVPQEVSR